MLNSPPHPLDPLKQNLRGLVLSEAPRQEYKTDGGSFSTRVYNLEGVIKKRKETGL